MDRREQIAHLAATREEEMLLVRVCEKLDTAVQRDIPAATNFLSKREQMLVCEVLRGAPIRFFGGLSTAEREISCYLPDYLDEDWLAGVRVMVYDFDKFVAADLMGIIQKYRVTSFCAPPTIYRFLIKEGDGRVRPVQPGIRHQRGGGPQL